MCCEGTLCGHACALGSACVNVGAPKGSSCVGYCVGITRYCGKIGTFGIAYSAIFHRCANHLQVNCHWGFVVCTAYLTVRLSIAHGAILSYD
jgi:hypothetical protein